MITLHNVSKTFDRLTAVNNISLHIKPQEIFGIVGPDGAGKTTLLRMICGLTDADKGSIELFGQPIAQLDEFRSSFGYMPQKFSLYGDLTIKENINFFGSLYGLDKATIKKRAEETLSVTGLLPFIDRMAAKLSGGMRQKLSLCSALITRPALLILDEPTFGVDPESRREFWKILYNLNYEGMTVLVTTPYMDEAELCSRVGFLSEGILKTVNTPAQLKAEFPFEVVEIHTTIKDAAFLNNVAGIVDLAFYGYKYRLIVKNAANLMATLPLKLDQDYSLMEEVAPTMEDLFIILAEREL